MTPNKDAIEKAIEALEYYLGAKILDCNYCYIINHDDSCKTGDDDGFVAKEALQLLREYRGAKVSGPSSSVGGGIVHNDGTVEYFQSKQPSEGVDGEFTIQMGRELLEECGSTFAALKRLHGFINKANTPIYSGKTFSIADMEEAKIIVMTWERELYPPDKRLLAAIKILREAAPQALQGAGG